jgi:hypothetical protein
MNSTHRLATGGWYELYLVVSISSGQKLTLAILATISLKVVPIHAYASFLVPFFIFILEVVFCDGA